MKFSLFQTIAIILTSLGCVDKKSTAPVAPAVPTSSAVGPSIKTPSVLDYKSPATILTALDNVRATFIITDSLLVPEEKLRSYCPDLFKNGYNLAFVNVQARGYSLNKVGTLISTPNGNVLIPGHPLIKVLDPISVLRSECSKQPRPIAIVPWFEYNAMAEQVNGSLDIRGKGYDEKGELVSVKLYNSGDDKPSTYSDRSQTFYPSSWYLTGSKKNSLYVSKLGLRWLDSRKSEVSNFLFNFAQKVADTYGPLQNWDRLRFTPDAGLGLEQEIANKDNSQTQFVQRLGSMLKSRGGALWATVVKQAVKSSRGRLNEIYGQYWTSEPWLRAVQLFIPMTYFEDMNSFEADLAKISEDSKTLGFKALPIVGLDRNLSEMRGAFAPLLTQQRALVLSRVGQNGLIGYADWYYWP